MLEEENPYIDYCILEKNECPVINKKCCNQGLEDPLDRFHKKTEKDSFYYQHGRIVEMIP